MKDHPPRSPIADRSYRSNDDAPLSGFRQPGDVFDEIHAIKIVDLRWGSGMRGARNLVETRALVDPDAYGENAEGRCARGRADRGECCVRDASFRMSSIHPRRAGPTRRMGFGPDGDGVKMGRYG